MPTDFERSLVTPEVKQRVREPVPIDVHEYVLMVVVDHASLGECGMAIVRHHANVPS